jgi:poly(3-hydroxybutyrate) depolymerase/CubicO group peptidase (beta-lactamase class C family)
LPAAAGETAAMTIRVGELEREYRLHLPAGYDRSTPTSLVLDIHGYTGDARSEELVTTGMSKHADEHGYIVVYPQATSFVAGDGTTVTSWNDLACSSSPGPHGPTCSPTSFKYPAAPECGEPTLCNWCTCHDDLAFIEQLLDRLEETLCIDLDRIYATGMSNGGMFVHRLGCTLPHRFAAIAPVAGTLARGFSCAPSRVTPISIMNIWGSRDDYVAEDGSVSSDGYLYTAATEVMETWASEASQGCDADLSPYQTIADGTRGLRCHQHAGCFTSAEVVNCTWDGAHDWPKDDSNEFGNEIIWEFFSRHRRSDYTAGEPEPVHQLGKRGIVRDWLVSGPFPNPLVDEPTTGGSDQSGFTTDFLADLGGEAKAPLTPGTTVTYIDRNGVRRNPVTWRVSAAESGEVDLDKLFNHVDHRVAYAFCYIRSDRPQAAGFRFGSDDSAKVWINGKLVHSIDAGRALVLGEDRFTAELKQGFNSVLVKVSDLVRGWGFALEALNAEGLAELEVEEQARSDFKDFLDCRVVPDLGNEWDYTFGPGKLPRLDWEKPYLVKKVLGDFPLAVRWFDADLNEVTSAEKAGRYAYVVDASTADGVHISRAGTLYCRPDDWFGWSEKPRAHLEYMPATTVDRAAWDQHREAIADFAGRQILLSILRQEEGAILLSYLHEMVATGKTTSGTDTPLIRDHEYHLALKRKLMGIEDTYPPLNRPRKIEGESAPILHMGTAAEAGVAADTAERLRDVCQSWFEESGEPFDLLVARHGVIVIHEAFGDWSWGEMTLDTPKPVASITKLITGLMFAELVDQGLIGIDDPVGKFLPDFAVTGDKAVTLRHCFTHTSGLYGHEEWGGLHNPRLENVAANAIHQLPVGKVHSYNGMGYNLAGRVMEVVSGKSIFRLLRENLFDPLDLNSTVQEEDLGFSCNTTAGDLAVLGQLLLNQGSYGDLRFFSPQTFAQLLPTQLSRFYPGIDIEWGIGLTWMRQAHPDAGTQGLPEDATILGKHVIGHGSATSSVLRIDLDNDLVIAQTRRIDGKSYNKYLTELLMAIEAGLIE